MSVSLCFQSADWRKRFRSPQVEAGELHALEELTDRLAADAPLPQPIWPRFDQHGIRRYGARLRSNLAALLDHPSGELRLR
ncbi:hypothetical protein AVEN_266904-1 [Araneus ventricosus]|uniref:Uncharacterized protein n=1 Tax=Araneus ventricosus TaxID=182803 RepID=A0A4Y2DDX2_ARAVE|nr:hypothetical protein AVEN_266904-1 [Araneus ventricosus]